MYYAALAADIVPLGFYVMAADSEVFPLLL